MLGIFLIVTYSKCMGFCNACRHVVGLWAVYAGCDACAYRGCMACRNKVFQPALVVNVVVNVLNKSCYILCLVCAIYVGVLVMLIVQLSIVCLCSKYVRLCSGALYMVQSVAGYG